MLSMKTLRVAIVTIGAALLLGPGFAAAQTTLQQLDGAGTAAATAYTYASESLAAGDVDRHYTPAGATNPTHFGLKSPGAIAQWLSVATRGRVEANSNVRVRLDLGGGAVFNGQPLNFQKNTSATTTGATFVAVRAYADRQEGGSAGDDFVIFSMGPSDVAIDDHLFIEVTDAVAVPPGTGSYTASISASGSDAPGRLGGSATIVNVVSALDASVTKAADVIADVGTGFLQFTADTSLNAQNTGVARLGMFHAKVASLTSGMILAADDGEAAAASDVIKAGDTAVGLTVKGDLSIGAFKIVADAQADAAAGTPNTADCAASGAPAATAKTATKSDLTSTASKPNEGTASRAAGSYELCVDVNDEGTNTTPIPEGEYTATVSVTGPGTAAQPAVAVDDKTIGKITRDGTSVRVTYLTASEKYNQRLIIVNRGNRDITYNIGEFVMEDGTMVEGTSMATGMIKAKSQGVMRVRDLLNFTAGNMRAAATVTADGTMSSISVATTQVNLEDGSTDTVLYGSQ